MLRQPSHSSSISNSASPKGRLSFFKKRSSASSTISREDHGSSDKIFDLQHSDKIPNSPIFPDLELARSSNVNGIPSPDSFLAAAHDPEYLHLRENIRRIRKAPSGPDPKKVDAAWEVYKKLREVSLHICRSLLQKSQTQGRHASLETNISPLDTRSSFSGSLTETTIHYQVNDQWLAAITEYKSAQEAMLENLRTSLVTTYKAYEVGASERQLQAFLSDKVLRKNLIDKWRDESIHRMKSEKHLFWEHYRIRSLNFDRLKLDLKAIEKLLGEAEDGRAPNMAIREYVIAKDGDTILEFANAASEIHPILRFRVSSHLLAAASPLFSQFLSPQKPGSGQPLDMISQLPPAPSRHICKDGMEVKVYQMPQIESNNDEALTLLFHAAHMHNPQIPRQIEFQVFVSIAEVCLRYRCTSPLELQVEYQWLPQWIHMIGDDNVDGFLIIAYAFGLRRIFTRMSKSAILNATSDEDIQSKSLWPQAVRDKIKATRAAKLAQIQDCCTTAIGEYFRTPSEPADRLSTVGSLHLTSQPRCPRNSHMCDATNLGWLMLVYNELRILPSILKDVGSRNLPESPQRSVRELVDCLRLMPSAPQVHSGVCDYAAAFRSDINDIYNSVRGLTLHDVSGRNGWALSKNAGASEARSDDPSRDAVELEAPIEYTRDTKRETAMFNEDVSLRILSHLENMEDLNSAAMIDKTFYLAYKRNEATLLKNVFKAERRRTLSQVNPDIAGVRKGLRPNPQKPSPLNISIPNSNEEPKSLAADRLRFPPAATAGSDTDSNDLYDASPAFSPIDDEDDDDEVEEVDELPMSEEEAHRILWPDSISAQVSSSIVPVNDRVSENNEKFLLGDVVHVEDKVRMVEDDKHLRDEKDMALGLGSYKK
ncbi:hypothetical protein DL95DRAFT_338622 [Leptodontidium sp. 2 PMI_412]|nr:hypothetical protein BKA61DRAFT_559401 [Leptodontidium sp. MPI-SDFR-AT-0119]KAH9213775.1 hypothetical protein DL95DRAFT_338622 [Leptodontidium sp. 2 PMI_412]